MTESVLVALISAGLPTVASLAAVAQTRRTRRDLAGAPGDSRTFGERMAVVETKVDVLTEDVREIKRRQ
ncbi:MAG: hypothetical protein L6311_16570 [Cellulomonas sp.]|nr:hypothetical protein [Cellulomonas sp.]